MHNSVDIMQSYIPIHSCTHNIGVVMSLENSEYTVYEEDQFVEVCVELIEGTIRRTIPVMISTVMISAGVSVLSLHIHVDV